MSESIMIVAALLSAAFACFRNFVLKLTFRT